MNKLKNSNNPVVKQKKNYDLLDASANLRNLIVHNSDLKLALPTEDFVSIFEKLVNEVLNPKQVQDKMIKLANLKYCTLKNSIQKAYKIMQENNLSNIPILEGKILKGVFSESTIMLLAENDYKDLCIDLQEKTFNEIINEISIEKHPSLSYPVVPRKLAILEAIKLFTKDGYKSGKRTELLFVTNNGKSHEDLLGILSPYDLLDLLVE